MSKKVLVIDDEADVRKFLTTLLEKNGYETRVASDGVEGLEVARQEGPDLVILDLLMPKQSGTDFYRKFTRDKNLEGVPVIVVSGLAGRNLAVPRPAAVFDKPIDPSAFIEAVEQALA
jgi:twitching motility two-component system response regulator PilH